MKGPAKKTDRSGFTLGELLIVIGIIAVLVGIAIPVINIKLEKAREAYDIHTMRQAASAAVELFYEGITDSASARAAGLLWNDGGDNGSNAYGVYDPSTGRFLAKSSGQTGNMSYGKGTKKDGGTRYSLGNTTGSYAADQDYTKAVVMVSIFPRGSNPHVDVYWKTSDKVYVGGGKNNIPNYSIRINLS